MLLCDTRTEREIQKTTYKKRQAAPWVSWAGGEKMRLSNFFKDFQNGAFGNGSYTV